MSTAKTILRRIVSTAKAAKVNSPYNQAIVADRTVYVSGCLGMDRTTGALVAGGVAAETRAALANLQAILEAADSGTDRVVKTTIFVQNLQEFGTVNEEYRKVFAGQQPARSTVQVAALPLGAAVEIEAVALTGAVRTVEQ